MKIDDYEKLTLEQKEALRKLLLKHPFQDLFHIGDNDGVILAHRIVRHFSSKRGRSWPRVRYEVLDNEKRIRGSHGSYYRSLRTLSINTKNSLSIKKRKAGKDRIVKEIEIDYSDKPEVQQIEREAKYMENQLFFHAKSLVRTENSAFIVMRLPTETVLKEFLEQKTLSTEECLQLSLALVTALKDQIHALKLVHGNLNLDTIYIEQQNQTYKVFIHDYSEIKEQSSRRLDLQFFNNNTLTGQQSDIYSMGKILLGVWGVDKAEEVGKGKEMANTYKKQLRDLVLSICDPQAKEQPGIDEIISGFNVLIDKITKGKPPSDKSTEVSTPGK